VRELQSLCLDVELINKDGSGNGNGHGDGVGTGEAIIVGGSAGE